MKAIQKQVQMLQNIETPKANRDILHLQSKVWVPSPSELDDEAVRRSSKSDGKMGKLIFLSASEKLSMGKPDVKKFVGMVDVVRRRQFPESSGWTAGGYMVVLPTKWECEAYTPLPSLRSRCDTWGADALILGTV